MRREHWDVDEKEICPWCGAKVTAKRYNRHVKACEEKAKWRKFEHRNGKLEEVH